MTVRRWLCRIFVCPWRGHDDASGIRWGWHLDSKTFTYCTRCEKETP